MARHSDPSRVDRALSEMSYAGLPASMGKPCAILLRAVPFAMVNSERQLSHKRRLAIIHEPQVRILNTDLARNLASPVKRICKLPHHRRLQPNLELVDAEVSVVRGPV
jgi:hypothetical protein